MNMQPVGINKGKNTHTAERSCWPLRAAPLYVCFYPKAEAMDTDIEVLYLTD